MPEGSYSKLHTSDSVAEPIASYGARGGEIILYQAPEGGVSLNVRLDKETLWLNLN